MEAMLQKRFEDALHIYERALALYPDAQTATTLQSNVERLRALMLTSC